MIYVIIMFWLCHVEVGVLVITSCILETVRMMSPGGVFSFQMFKSRDARGGLLQLLEYIQYIYFKLPKLKHWKE